ncbi:MAG TPA: hypothetical protein VF069_00805 [Streptosporangiaceae bacterium]
MLATIVTLAVPIAKARASDTVVWGPGCANNNTTNPNFPGELDYGPTGGTWWHYTGLDANGKNPDFSGSGRLGACDGSIYYAWNGTAENYQWVIRDAFGFIAPGSRCTIDAYIPTSNAGVYAARYDVWWQDINNSWHWLAWPGHDIDQEHSSGWTSIMSAFTFTSSMVNFRITLHDDTANDVSWRYMGAGDMRLNC